MTLESTWLIQRLTKPWKNDTILGGKDNPFSFGGGYKNGGLSDEAMDLLRPCFGFDYMGSAEFEFGAVPEALAKIAKLADEGDLEASVVEIDKTTIHPGWSKDDKPQPGTVDVYVLADANHQDEIAQRIQWIAQEWEKNPHPEWGITKDIVSFKETPQFGTTILGKEYTDRNGGWLELDNGFLFFTDEQMFARTASVFGVKTDVEIETT